VAVTRALPGKPGVEAHGLWIPLITVAAGVWLVFAVFITWQCLTQDPVGVNSTKGLVFLGVMYGVSAIVYLGARWYRDASRASTSASPTPSCGGVR